jgi:thiopeptide-type bacteriocin biosynthesis protein
MPTDRLETAEPQHTLPDEEGAWQHYSVQFTDWGYAQDQARTYLLPLLDALPQHAPWWFVRKHPRWRIRVDAADPATRAHLARGLDLLVSTCVLVNWTPGIYEPETAAFGGRLAMDAAHDLFCADSHAILTPPRPGPAPGVRETSLLLCNALMRGAGLEWYERGDVWDRVAKERPLPADTPVERVGALAEQIRTLLLADGAPGASLLGPDDPHGRVAAFTHTGTCLRALADTGQLERGLRAVLGYHVIFHWNRIGLPGNVQAILARAARDAILHQPDQPLAPETPATAVREHDLEAIAETFPLVNQPRLCAGDLASRVEEAISFARTLENPGTEEQQVENACATWNLAALIAADCGPTDLAVDLCWRQFALFQAAWPLAGRIAIASLQPLVNLIRLTSRAGNPLDAYHALTTLEHAVHHGGTAQIHGQVINFDTFAQRPEGLDRVEPWLRTVLCEDGTRALMAAHAWDQAAVHTGHYDDHHDLLREARQTHIFAHTLAGNPDQALSLLDTGTITQPWEKAVAAILRCCILRHIGSSQHGDTHSMFSAVRLARADPQRATIRFRTRLALTAIDLPGAEDHAASTTLAGQVASDIQNFGDCFSARDALAHHGARSLMTQPDIDVLAAIVRDAGLGAGAMPAHLLEQLDTAVALAEEALTRMLTITR